MAAKVAKVFKNGRSQAVRIPKEFRLNVDEVLIERKGRTLVLTPSEPRPWKSWKEYFATLDPIDDDFQVPEDTPIKTTKGF
ncbi:MAG TPA: antitoxin [Candidatus Binataceae bacterium]|nr:antitoxin [Candidatus Binataceae bacterium]